MMEELRDTCQSREVPEEGGDRVDAGRFALGREREREMSYPNHLIICKSDNCIPFP